MAYRKGQFGSKVVRIGGQLAVPAQDIQAQIKQTIVGDIIMDIAKRGKTNVIIKDDLRSFVGRRNQVAASFVMMRHFLHANTIWRKQVGPALDLFGIFFVDATLPGGLKNLTLEEFNYTRGDPFEVVPEGPPWGIGGS